MSFEDDRGGNEVGVSGLCSWNLHAVWDRCIIERGLPGAPYTLAQQLLDEVTDQDRATWQGSSPIDWANESFGISTSPGGRALHPQRHRVLVRRYDAGNERLDPGEPERTVTVDRSYIVAHTATVREQLARAGVRLSGLLNQVFGE